MGVFRIQLDRFGIVGDGLVVLALETVCPAAAEVGEGVFRIQLDRFGIVGDGTVVLALAVVGVAAIVVGRG